MIVAFDRGPVKVQYMYNANAVQLHFVDQWLKLTPFQLTSYIIHSILFRCSIYCPIGPLRIVYECIFMQCMLVHMHFRVCAYRYCSQAILSFFHYQS